ncbi:N-carbamoylputrescine amidase [Kyrpidia spormannii]|uniref:N-carbamoylputrescine amidase n=1 Tax=Kyrpidia spormannii TaxID=2055160 RepID=A0A2K8N9T8_9BACL|nr:carbon-nitrogen hydrolase [Kyrpidia spormannii]ATY86063.1 N-carbamoylputrescine amidase [Kyrpidia spormannii]
MRAVTMGLIQLHCTPDPEANIERTISAIQDAATKGAQIVCLQELFHLQYFPQRVAMENYNLAQPTDGPLLERMGRVAAELGIVLIVPFYERAGKGMYFNSAAVFDADGTMLGVTRKNHIPESPQYYEKYYFSPGNTGYPVYATQYGVIGVGICWDEWFPEVSRILALRGAEILFFPSAIGSEPEHPHISTKRAWEKAISAQGIYNGVFVAAVNRVGQEDQMTFYGGSFVSDPFGEIKESLSDQEGLLLCTVDLTDISFARNLLQFLRDRRVETYQPLLELENFQAGGKVHAKGRLDSRK